MLVVLLNRSAGKIGGAPRITARLVPPLPFITIFRGGGRHPLLSPKRETEAAGRPAMYRFATPCVTKSSRLCLQLTLLRLPSDAPDDRPSPGVIVEGDGLLILVLTSLTGNAVRRRINDES
jgi:hypothetical protein